MFADFILVSITFQLGMLDSIPPWTRTSIFQYLSRPIHVGRHLVVDWTDCTEAAMFLSMQNINSENTLRVLREILKRYAHLCDYFGASVQIVCLTQLIQTVLKDENIRPIERRRRSDSPADKPFSEQKSLGYTNF